MKETMPARKSHEDFVKDLYGVSPSLTVVGVYSGCHSEVSVRCRVCGYTWKPTAHNLLSRHSGCPRCVGLERKTTDVFASDLSKVNKTIQVVGEYSTSKLPIDVSCKVCSYKWSATPNNLLKGSGCPECNTSGFKKSEVATFYVYEFQNAYGFGVTNSMWDRDRTHRRNFRKEKLKGKLLYTVNGMGDKVLDFEKSVITTLPTIDLGVDGFRREGLPKECIGDLFTMIVKSNLVSSLP